MLRVRVNPNPNPNPNQEGSHAELVAKRGLYYEMLNTGTGEDDDELT